MKLKSIVLLVAVALSSATAFAADININNASFEDDVLAVGTWTTNSIIGWNASNSGAFNQAGQIPQGVSSGSNVAWSNGGSISQVLTATLAADTVYTLSVDLLNRNDVQNVTSTLGFYAGNNLLASSLITGGVSGTTVLQSLTFTTGAANSFLGQQLQISLAGGGVQSDWDNVHLTAVAAVPEPETYAMLLAGLGLMGAVARRRKAKKA